jgi:hypothetical protein
MPECFYSIRQTTPASTPTPKKGVTENLVQTKENITQKEMKTRG